MTGYFTGLGSGVERGSVALLGGAGLFGGSSLGRAGEGVFVNAATGNLVLSRQDEFLVGLGGDVASARTYNSLGLIAYDDNGDLWRDGNDRRLLELTGTLNTQGSTIKRLSADGSLITYTYDTWSDGAYYRATEGLDVELHPTDETRYDKLEHTAAAGGNPAYWTWTDGATGVDEVYQDQGGGDWRIVSQRDGDGNTILFEYASGKLAKVTTADGRWIEYEWSGSNLISVATRHTVSGSPVTLSRTRYSYTSNRLTQVTVDLTPQDDSISDGKVYQTTFTYNGSNQLTNITQTDGSSLTIAYNAGKVSRLTQYVASGDARVTDIIYVDATHTDIKTYTNEALTHSVVTHLTYDADKRLTNVTLPPASSAAAAQSIDYAYDGLGNVTQTIETLTSKLKRQTDIVYDARGNATQTTVTLKTESGGVWTDTVDEVVQRAYNAANNLTLVTTTRSSASAASASAYDRFIYDGEEHLRYSVSADGLVTEYRYTTTGELEYVVRYPAHLYGPGSAIPSLGDMDTWRNGLTDRSTTSITKNIYDARGDLVETRAYGKADASGAPISSEGESRQTFTYDHAGRVLTRATAGQLAETFVYDGMGRLILSTDLAGGTTSVAFNDAATTTTVTTAAVLDSGAWVASSASYVAVTTFNKAGELITKTDSGSYTTSGTYAYKYDKLGRLRQRIDTVGETTTAGMGPVNTYFIYDNSGRKVADVGHSGELTEYKYDVAGRQIATILYTYALTAGQLTTLANPESDVELGQGGFNRPTAHGYDIWSWTVYDAAGRVVETIAGDGAVTTYAYDPADRLIKTTSYYNKLSAGDITTLKAASSTSVTLPTADSAKDVVTRTFYDLDGRVIGALNPEGGLSQIFYDRAGRKIQETAYFNPTNASLRASGTFDQLRTSFGADANKDVTNRFIYDGQGLLRYTVDALNRVTELVYWQGTNTETHAHGQVIKTIVHDTPLAASFSDFSYAAVKIAVGAETSADRASRAIYNNRGQLRYTVDAMGAVAAFAYDSLGRVTKTTAYGDFNLASVPADASGWEADLDSWTASHSANVRITRTYYAARGDVRFVVDAEGYVSRFDYNGAGRISDEHRFAAKVTATDASTIADIAASTGAPTGSTVSLYHRYTALGQLQYTQRSGTGDFTYYGYFANGTVGTLIEGTWDNQRKTYAVFDASGKKISETTFTTQLEGATPVGANATSMTSYQRLISANGQYQMLLTPGGELQLFHNGEMIWTNGVHESVAGASYQMVAQTDGNLVIKRIVSGQPDVVIWSSATAGSHAGATFFALADNGVFSFNKGTAPTGTGVIWSTPTSGLTALNPQAAVSVTTTYAYDGLGNLVALARPDNRNAFFEYDRLGRVTKETDALGAYTTYEYDAFGRGVKTTDKRGHASYAIFDRLGRVVATVDAEGYVTKTTYTAFGEVKAVTRQLTREAQQFVSTWAAGGTGLVLNQEMLDGRLSWVARNDHGEKPPWEVLTAWGGGIGVFNGDRPDGAITVQAGDTVSFSFEGKTLDAGVTVYARFAFLKSDGSWVEGGFITSTGDGWQALAGSATAPTGAVAVQLGIFSFRTDGNLNGGFDFAMHNLSVKKNDIEVGASTQFQYDKLSQVTTATDAEGYYEQYTLDAFGQREAVRNKLGGWTNYTYDKRGLVTAEVLPTLAYLSNGNAQSQTGITNKFEYDSRGNQVKLTEAFGLTEQRITEYGYDNADRLVLITHPSVLAVANATAAVPGAAVARTEQFFYDSRGNLIESRDEAGAKTFYWYDALDRITHTVSPTGTVTRHFYDKNGNVIETRVYATQLSSLPADARGAPPSASGSARIQQFEYDNLNRLTKTKTLSVRAAVYTSSLAIAAPATVFTQYEYDSIGNVVRVTDANGKQTWSYYDKAGRKTVEIDAANYRTDWIYDTNSNVLTERRYATAGAAPTVTTAPPTAPATHADDRVTEFTYDKLGQRVSERRLNVTVRASYNRLDNAGGYPKQAFSSGATSESGGVPGWFFSTNDANGAQIHGANTLAGPEWMASGDPSTFVVWQMDAQTGVTYDIGQVTSVSAGQNYVFSAYTGAHRATVEVFIEWRDANNQVLSESHSSDAVAKNQGEAGGGQALSGYKRIWVNGTAPPTATQARVIIRKHATNAGSSDSWMFVTRPQLESVSAGAAPPAIWVDPASDAAVVDSIITYAYNGLGQVAKKTEASGEAINYAYDASGRMTSEERSSFADVNGAAVKPRIEYSYDGLSNLVRTRALGASGAVSAATRDTLYAYGAGGRLASMTDAAGFIRTYRYDLAGRLTREEYVRVTPTGSVTEGVGYDYDLEGRVTKQGAVINASGWTRTGANIDTAVMKYNAFGEISERGVNDLYAEKYFYDDAGRLVRTNSGDGVWKYFMYDAGGNQTLMITSAGSDLGAAALDTLDEVLALWTGGVSTIATTNVTGVVATITKYDARNQAIQVLEPQRQRNASTFDNLTTTRAYNAFGEVIQEVNANAAQIDYSYNTMGRLIKTESPAVEGVGANGKWIIGYSGFTPNADSVTATTFRPVEHRYYDVSGRLVASRDANGNLTRMTLLEGSGYNGAEALVKVQTGADGGTITTGYDIHGDARKITDQLAHVTTQTFDDLGRLIQVNRAAGLIENYSYDGLSQRIKHWTNLLGSGDANETTYDHQGRVTRMRTMGGDTTDYAYAWSAALATGGMETFGGWTTTTTHVNGKVGTEQADQFGRAIAKTDLGGHASSFTYDKAGRLTQRGGGSAINYTYFNTGRIYTTAEGSLRTTTLGYNKLGQVVSELLVAGAQTHKNMTASYDALGRMITWTDAESTWVPGATANYWYDANGNIRKTSGTVKSIQANGVHFAAANPFEHWYRYDSMNRMTTQKGKMIAGAIDRELVGIDYMYDLAGNRVQALTGYLGQYVDHYEYDPEVDPKPVPVYGYFTGTKREDYVYDNVNRLIEIKASSTSWNASTQTVNPAPAPTKTTSFVYDLMGRLDLQYGWNSNGVVLSTRNLDYNAKGQLTTETNDSGTTTVVHTVATHAYGSGASYALGSALTITTTGTSTTNGVVTNLPTSLMTNTYVWWDSAVQDHQAYKPNISSGPTHDSQYTYAQVGGAAQLTSVTTDDGRPRTVTFRNDMNGQAIRRDEADNNGTYGDPHEVWYRFAGKQIGFTGNNGAPDAEIANSSSGAFMGGQTSPTYYTDFDVSLTALAQNNARSVASTYVVEQGDTLESIAAMLWGDASLWFELAEANGLQGSETLTAGQTLIIPAGIVRASHNASTFAPYDPGEVINPITLTAPKPAKAKAKCGGMGTILMVVIAIAVVAITKLPMQQFFASLFAGGGQAGALAAASVTAASTSGATLTGAALAGSIAGGAAAGAAGSIASQAFGVATGIQDKFSWNAVALAAIGGGIGGSGSNLGVGGSSPMASALRGMVASAATQGIGVALGLQKSFSWAGVAAAGVGAGVAHAVGASLPDGIGEFGARVVTNTASGIAMAATRTLIEGSDFGDNVLASLPDIIGQTIGDSFAAGIADARLNRRTDRVLEEVGIEGPRGDIQQTRLFTRSVLAAGGSESDAIALLSRDDFRTSLAQLDRAQARGLSADEAGQRVRGFAESSPELIELDTLVIEAIGPNGPSGRSILADTIGGGVGLMDSFATLYDENQVLAEVGFFGVSAVIGGPTKTILKRAMGETGDRLVEAGANAFGTAVRGFVTHVATKHKWTVAFSIAGYATDADAGLIGLGAGGLASSAVEIGLGAGAGQVVDRIKDLRRPYIRRSVRQDVEAAAPRTADGRAIDPNTLEPIDGRPDLGHRTGNEFWRERDRAQAEGLSQAEFNDRMNDPDLYQLEDPVSNRSHRHEQRR